MPIAQVRTTSESQWLTVPLLPIPNQLDVIREWQKPVWDSELVVYPKGYMGNVSPVGWRSVSNFLLHVADNGERANVLAMSNIPDQKMPTALVTELQYASPDELRAIGSLAIVDHENKTAFISTALGGNKLAIGGIVLHADIDELTFLRSLFQESSVQIPPV